jgi:hypothetical protein
MLIYSQFAVKFGRGMHFARNRETVADDFKTILERHHPLLQPQQTGEDVDSTQISTPKAKFVCMYLGLCNTGILLILN